MHRFSLVKVVVEMKSPEWEKTRVCRLGKEKDWSEMERSEREGVYNFKF